MKQFYVHQNEAGQRLDKLLFKILNTAPKSFVYKMLRKKNIVLNGKKADGSEKLKADDEVKLFLSEETIAKFQEAADPVEPAQPLDVLYENQSILIVNKPVGVLSQKAAKDDVSMVEYIMSYLIFTKQLTKEQLISFKPGICNRLDRNTSGLLIAGKSLPGLQNMAELLKNRSLDKYYLCIVKGIVKEKKRIEGYLKKNEAKNQVKVYPDQVEDSEYICTEYRPLQYSKGNGAARTFNQKDVFGYTLLEVKLVTGRSHQIRAHLASIGYPILGDFKYGDSKTNRDFKEKYGLTYQLLHSYRMVFPTMDGELGTVSGKEFCAEPTGLFHTIEADLFHS
jgi:23S rRNA pseudouridine955/2504/2580 synthase